MTDLEYEKRTRSRNLYGRGEPIADVTRWRKPDRVFDERLHIDLGGIVVQLRHFGPGNTPGDTIVYLEYFTGFQYRWPVEIFEAKPYPDKQFVAINVGSYTLFVLSGIALLKNIPEFVMPAVFFVVMGVVGNGIQHPIYSVMVRGYFPGLWTSIPNLIIGPILLRELLSGTSGATVAHPALAC